MENLTWPKRGHRSLLGDFVDHRRGAGGGRRRKPFLFLLELLGLEAGIQKQAMDEVDDDEQIADDDPEFPPGELEINFPELDGQKRAGRDQDHVLGPMFAQVEPDPFRSEDRAIKKRPETEKL